MPKTWNEESVGLPNANGFNSWRSWYCRMLAFANNLFSPLPRFDFEDPKIVSLNVLPKHVPLCLYTSKEEAMNCGLLQGLPRKLSLSHALLLDSSFANWKFKLFDKYELVPEITSIEHSTFGENCNVPANWQIGNERDPPLYTNFSYPFQGRRSLLNTFVPREGNFCGVYSALAQVPSTWQDEEEFDLVLILHAAGPFVRVCCNGKVLGYHTDSLTEHEYLCPAATGGVIHIVLEIVKFCAASYLEDQDQWWLTGVHRSVELQRRRRCAVLIDYHVNTSSLADITLQCELQSSSPPSEYLCQVSVPELSLHHTIEFSNTKPVTTMIPPEKGAIKLWTPETPHLYTLLLELVRKADGKVLQVEISRIGFRNMKITPTGEIQLNGNRFVFRGVNRHEFSPNTGKSVSELEMQCDALQMKRFNFNAVRHSHYPNTHRWYELCDYYGLLVIDECNIETHGFMMAHGLSMLQFDSRFRGQFLHRAHAMVSRARNHACVCMWSLGNESGYGPNMQACSALIRKMDPTRLVVYEGANGREDNNGVALERGDGTGQVSDVIFPMYSVPQDLVRLAARGGDARPIVLCEYAHCMGNSLGNLHEYWDLFWGDNGTSNKLQGGFIWDWVDQAICLKQHSQLLPSREEHLKFAAEQGWGYGGDFVRHAVVQEDAQFCCNGLVFPDRTPKPGLYEAKYLMQPFTFALSDDNMLTVQQRYALCEDWQVEIKLRVDSRRSSVDLTTIPLTLPLKQQQDFVLDLPVRNNDVSILMVSAIVYNCYEVAEHVLATESFELVGESLAAVQPLLLGNVTFLHDQSVLHITMSSAATATIDLCTGALTSYKCAEEERLAGPSMLPVFTRACVDNDLGGIPGNSSYQTKWVTNGLDKYTETYKWPYVRVEFNEQQQVDVHFQDDTFHVYITHLFSSSGEIQVDVQVEVLKLLNVDSLPRVGMFCELTFDSHVRYLGRGNVENYADRKRGSLLGYWHNSKVDDFYVPYIFPSENGARCDVRWLELCSNNDMNAVVGFTCEPPLQVTLSKFHISQLERATHQSDLLLLPVPTQSTKVVFDHAQMGVGGDVSWLPSVHDEYKINPHKGKWRFKVTMRNSNSV